MKKYLIATLKALLFLSLIAGCIYFGCWLAYHCFGISNGESYGCFMAMIHGCSIGHNLLISIFDDAIVCMPSEQSICYYIMFWIGVLVAVIRWIFILLIISLGCYYCYNND